MEEAESRGTQACQRSGQHEQERTRETAQIDLLVREEEPNKMEKSKQVHQKTERPATWSKLRRSLRSQQKKNPAGNMKLANNRSKWRFLDVSHIYLRDYKLHHVPETNILA